MADAPRALLRGAGQVVSMRDDQDDDIAAALDRLHAGGDRIGDTAFCVEGGGLAHVVTGSNGANMIRARRAPRRDVGRSTGPQRSGCCRGGLGRRCRAGDRRARPGQPLRDHRVLDRIRRHFRFQRTLRDADRSPGHHGHGRPLWPRIGHLGHEVVRTSSPSVVGTRTRSRIVAGPQDHPRLGGPDRACSRRFWASARTASSNSGRNPSPRMTASKDSSSRPTS